MKLLVEKGADVQAKANGRFFQINADLGFYFGEQPNINIYIFNI